nr:WRKY transcription factor [Panax notoginseng]
MDSGIVDLSLSINLNVSPPPNIDDDHHHQTPNKSQGAFVDEKKPSLMKHENDPIVDELNRMNTENERLTKMLALVCENYNTLQSRFAELVQKDTSSTSPPTKRKSADQEHENYGNVYYCDLQGADSYKRLKEVKTNVSRVFVRIDPSDKTLVVKDGYHWRKYGQKVTRDNPSPRAYYKCSFAPNCPVKKKVQRSVEDCTMVVATYEGEHNHKNLSQAKEPMGFNQNVVPDSSPGSNSMPLGNSSDIELDLVQPAAGRLCSISTTNVVVPQAAKSPPHLVQQLLVEEMASSLTRNPCFTEALAAAISNKILEYDLEDGW